MIPTLIHPKLWAVRNRWKSNLSNSAQFFRDIFLTCFGLVLMIVIYRGVLAALRKAHAEIHVAYLPPDLPLGLVLMFLFIMLLLSSSVSALGTFFLGKDLDLVLASPISPLRFYYGKFIDILGSSSWMAIIFGLPSILGFASYYKAPLEFYLIAFIVLIPYFVIPTAVAIIAVHIFTSIIPANRTREILFVILGLLIISLFMLARVLIPDASSLRNADDILRMVAILNVPNTNWVPSYWVSRILGNLLDGTGKPWVPYLSMLYAAAISLSALGFILFRQTHFNAYSNAKNNQRGIKLQSRRSQHSLTRLTPFLGNQSRALFAKDFKVFSRDMTQAVQLVILLGLCMIYLYNFKILRAVGGITDDTRAWWQGFLIMSNMAMGAFVTTAICTRFVFPSISLEGQSYWLLQTAPISVKDILRTKFWSWCIPVALMSGIIFTSGALAINVEGYVVILNAVSSVIICYGLVGLGVGLGAYFANFEWEHPSQLAASFGSLVFMLISTFLISINMAPAGLLIFLRTMNSVHHTLSTMDWYIAVGSSLLLIVYVNFISARWALQLGERALINRMR